MTAGTVLTFKAYARTQSNVANTVALRYLSGSTDDTLATIDAGSTFVLQGSLTYVTTSVNGGAGLIPPVVVPAGFSQNQLGQVLLNGSGSNFQPRAQLDVAGSNNVPALIVDQRSSSVGNDVVDFMVAGVKKVVIDSAGNVGVGTTAPGSALHVVGNARIQGDLTVNGTQTIINTNVGTTEQLVITNDGTGPALVVNQTGVQTVVDFQDDGVSALRIANGGNVGIGTTTPQAKLDVNGIIRGQGIYAYLIRNAGGGVGNGFTPIVWDNTGGYRLTSGLSQNGSNISFEYTGAYLINVSWRAGTGSDVTTFCALRSGTEIVALSHGTGYANTGLGVSYQFICNITNVSLTYSIDIYSASAITILNMSALYTNLPSIIATVVRIG
jgi:hypothetical protein